MKRFLLIATMILSTAVLAIAQNIKVQGNVVSKTDGEPVIGASVYVTGNTSTGTMTDFDGNFTLEVPQGTDLTVSYIGFQTQQVKAQATLNIILEEDSQMLDELVVVGYTVQRKADLTGAVSVLDMKKPASEGNPSMLSSMQGRLAGVQINTDAAPGSEGSSIRVRGMSSAIGGNSPLLVVDGVATESSINSINPADIESIQVLKDAASASIYGSRAANGVIIITTKRGKGDRLSVNVGYSASVQSVAEKYDLLDANQWGIMYARARQYDGASLSSDLYTFDGAGNARLNSTVTKDGKTYYLGNTDWQDAIYQTAWTHNTNASISNSGEKGSMMMSLNYITQNGIQKDTYYKRFSMRVNSTYNVNKWISIGENLMVARWDQNTGSNGGDRGTASLAMLQHPGIPVTQPDGSWSSPFLMAGSDYANPVESLSKAKDNKGENWRIFGNAYLEYKPIKGLTLKTNIGYEHLQYNSTTLTRATAQSSENSVARVYGQGDTWTWTNTATYVGNWGKHNLVALAGVEAIEYKGDDMSALRKNYMFEDKNYMILNAGDKDNIDNGGGKSSWALFSYFFKADYNFADRYLASFTIRRDATSRLHSSNNSGIFPAFTAAWRPTKEVFWKENNILTDLKVRFGWGQNGNAAINNYYAYWSTYAYDRNGAYDLGGTNTSAVSGIKLAASGNQDLKWETTTQTNIGVDMQFLGGDINFSADWYLKKTKDMITLPPALKVAGENADVYKNTGDMKNYGIEFTLDYHSPEYNNGISWSASLNVSKYKNEVVKLSDNVKYLGSNIRLMEGEPMGVYYGYIADGLFRSQDEADNAPTQANGAGNKAGRIRYRDLNGDGTINESDQCIIGDPNPDWSAGLNLDIKWKGLTLSTFFTGDFGFDIYNSNKMQLEFMSRGNTYTNRGSDILNAWTPENPNASIPAASFSNNNDETRMSTYYVQDGSYVKMKYIKLAYDLKPEWVKAIKASSLNVYAQLENVFTITKYDGLDPELNLGGYGCREDNGAYPRSRTFTIGVNVSF